MMDDAGLDTNSRNSRGRREPMFQEPGPSTSASTGEFAITDKVLMVGQPRSGQAEAIRTLRTHVVAQHLRKGRRGLAVCAASANVGCTHVGVNLAVALAQIGVKALLIDADLRRPGVDAFIQPKRAVAGLHHYLASYDMDVSQAIQEDVMPSLSVIFSGGQSHAPQELLASDRFETLLDFCLREYDATIIDTPPANTCADARRITSLVGYGLVVARRNKSFVNDIKTLAGQLTADRAQVVGTVLNEG